MPYQCFDGSVGELPAPAVLWGKHIGQSLGLAMKYQLHVPCTNLG